MPDIVIASAARTPIGTFNGTLAALPAHRLGEAAIRAALARASVDPAEVDEVILGQVLAAGGGQNPARQAAIAAGIPDTATAWGVNQLCGSGLRAVALGLSRLRSGQGQRHGGAIALGHPIGASGAHVLPRCSTRWDAATPARASPPCASAAAWASRSPSPATERPFGDHPRLERVRS